MSTDTPTDTPTDTWTAKRSLSYWLAIVAIPVGIMGALYLFWQENKTQVEVYVPAHDLPAYHQIQPSDLIPKLYASRAVSSDTLRTAQAIAGHYTLTPIPHAKPLTASQLSVKVNPTCLTDTIAVSLLATPAMTFGGNLKAGDTVSLTFAPPAPKAGASPKPALFPDLLVLDVKPVAQATTQNSVIVLALPKTAAEFATHLPDPTTLISRDLSGKGLHCAIQDH